jgi:transcriptional regulator with XRE-family HTH domain
MALRACGRDALQNALGAADIGRMDEPESLEDMGGTAGERLRRLRATRGMSRAGLAKRSGVRRRTIASLERGRREPSADELSAIAAACDVGVSALAPSPEPGLALAGGRSSAGGIEPIRGQLAFDALLREYLSMVVDLRQGRHAAANSIRQDDLTELARALGKTPEAIEARLMALLGTDEHEASQLRMAITPSLGAASHPAPATE